MYLNGFELWQHSDQQNHVTLHNQSFYSNHGRGMHMENNKISSETPEPIDIKFDVGDYVGDDITPHAKIQSNCPSGNVPANR